jgi:hypothetical protein
MNIDLCGAGEEIEVALCILMAAEAACSIASKSSTTGNICSSDLLRYAWHHHNIILKVVFGVALTLYC